MQYVVGPTVRASYRLREKATIEAEVGLEVTNENNDDPGIKAILALSVISVSSVTVWIFNANMRKG